MVGRKAMKRLVEVNLAEMGERVRSSRYEKGLSQSDLAKLAGTNQSFINVCESGTSTISVNTLASIASVLETSVDYLLFGNPSDTRLTPPNPIVEAIDRLPKNKQLIIIKIINLLELE